MIKNKLIGLSEDLWAAIEEAKGSGRPRSPFLEALLREVPEIREAAEKLDIEFKRRPEDGRGRHRSDAS